MANVRSLNSTAFLIQSLAYPLCLQQCSGQLYPTQLMWDWRTLHGKLLSLASNPAYRRSLWLDLWLLAAASFPQIPYYIGFLTYKFYQNPRPFPAYSIYSVFPNHVRYSLLLLDFSPNGAQYEFDKIPDLGQHKGRVQPQASWEAAHVWEFYLENNVSAGVKIADLHSYNLRKTSVMRNIPHRKNGLHREWWWMSVHTFIWVSGTCF